MPLRWPKGPFPERYRFGAVEARLASAWHAEDDVRLSPLLAGLTLVPPHDPWVRVYTTSERHDDAWHDALRARATELGATAFRWIAPARERRDAAEPSADAIGIVPTTDVVDAVSAVGIAGPNHGIGMPAIVRFLVTLRSFGRYEIEAMGEDAIVLRYTPKSDEALARVADRVLHLCPPLARSSSTEAIASSMRARGRLEMDWA